MEFIKQYLKILSYVSTGLVFAFASFYLLANLYHFFELRKDFYTSFNNELIVTDIDKTLETVNNNINAFNSSNYKGQIPTNNMNLVRQNLSNCISAFNNSAMSEMRNKNVITIVDVYRLRESYENDILNKCVVNNLHWLTEVDSSYGNYLVDNKDLSKLYIDALVASTSYLKKDLLNNSSYYYNTSIASASTLDNTRDGFYEVMDAYNRAAKLVLYVSEWYKVEVVK